VSSAGGGWVVQFLIEPKLRVIVLRGRPSDVERTANLIAELDRKPEVTVESYALRYTNAREVYETLREIIDKLERGKSGRYGGGRRDQGTGLQGGARGEVLAERLKVAASEQNNRIVVEGSPSDQEYLKQVIDAVDKPLPAGSGGMRVYRLENASAAEVAGVLESLIQGRRRETLARQEEKRGELYPAPQVGSPSEPGKAPQEAQGQTPKEPTAGDILPAQVTAAPEINAVIIRASAAEHEEFSSIISELDKPRRQVVLEARLVTVRSTDSFEFGFELAGADLGGGGPQQIGFSKFGIGAIDSATGQIRISPTAPFGLNYALFDDEDYSLVLNALRTMGDTRVTSSPKVLVQDNAQGVISQVNQEPYEVSNQGVSTTTTAFGGFVDAGTILTVTPHVSERGLRLDYSINLSAFGTRENENLPPPRLQNSVQGTVRVPDGKMVVLGGLVASDEQTVDSGVPLLMDIPVLGWLFKKRTRQTRNDTLFVFVKPVVIRDPAFRDLLYLSESDLKKAELFRAEEPVNELKLFGPES